MKKARRGGVGFLLAAALAGCGGTPAPAGTGAQAAARDFCEALIRKDWGGAHAALHPDSRAKTGAVPFSRQAEAYRRQLGFEPEQVAVRACEEHGTEAVAHVIIKGHAAAGPRSYKDALVLRQAESGWGVVLPPRFGEKR
jgi:hypothetical protein